MRVGAVKEIDPMAEREGTVDIHWYRVPLDKETMKELTRRSDWQGLLQTVGFLLVLCFTGAAAWLAWSRLPWYLVCAIFFVHGTFWAFLLPGFHELVHGTVFRTKALNAAFLFIYSFLSWNSPIAFKASHMKHHLNTLHPPYDLEVVLPIQLKPQGIFLVVLVDIMGIYLVLRDTVLLAFGIVRGEWQLSLFPPSDRMGRRPLVRWARIMLAGHALIVAAAALLGLWQLAVVVSFARFYGMWLEWMCNITQHAGLQDNVEDFRLCCRSIKLNPLVQFLYFHMNYHTEHHMYASVPCYRLGRLSRALGKAMPRRRWLLSAWVDIIRIMRRQKREPEYQYVMPLG
jgi:fatty acid desaturase